MQARFFQIVLAGNVTDGQNVADVFDGWCDGDRNHEQDSAPAERRCYEVWHCQPLSLLDRRCVNNAHDGREKVTHEDTEHDRDQPENALGPDRHDDGHGQRDHGNPYGSVVGHQLSLAVTGFARSHKHCYRSQPQADGHDDRCNHHRRQQPGNEAGTTQANRPGQNDIQNACGHQATEGFFQAKAAFGGQHGRDERER